MLTWTQLGIHAKPLAVVNVGGHWDGLVSWFERAVEDGFVRAESRSVVVVDGVDDVLPALRTAELPTMHKWLDLDET